MGTQASVFLTGALCPGLPVPGQAGRGRDLSAGAHRALLRGVKRSKGWTWHKAVGQNQWEPILVGRCTTRFSRDFSGDWDVHWGYDLEYDPWPHGNQQPGGRHGRESRHNPFPTKRLQADVRT